MKVYLVGGAVRDELLGLPVKERDWVVVGVTPEQMQAQGFRPVGKDFPVFLHPKTQEEYALARTERKQGRGYKGFQVYTDPTITLEQDLQRRDLTINAIAKDSNGKLIDPFNGKKDLELRLLRHVSPAFVEDPLRVLRIARFRAKLADFNFKLAPETEQLLLKMVASKELSDLVPDRVWLEWEKTFKTSAPWFFFETLHQIGALAELAPDLDRLWGVPNPPAYHPEIDTGIHTLMALKCATVLSEDPCIRFAALCHDWGKGMTNPKMWPSHHGHDEQGVELIKAFCQRYPVPIAFRDLAILSCRYHILCHHVAELKANTILKILESMDAWRRPQRVTDILTVCQADWQGRKNRHDFSYPQRDIWLNILKVALNVDIQGLMAKGYKGGKLGEVIREQRLKQIKEYLQ